MHSGIAFGMPLSSDTSSLSVALAASDTITMPLSWVRVNVVGVKD